MEIFQLLATAISYFKKRSSDFYCFFSRDNSWYSQHSCKDGLIARTHSYTCSYRPRVLRNDVAGMRWWRRRMCRSSCLRWGSRCLPPGGATCVGYPARSAPLPLPLGSFQVPDGTPPTPRNCWNYYFISANRARESLVSIHPSIRSRDLSPGISRKIFPHFSNYIYIIHVINNVR